MDNSTVGDTNTGWPIWLPPVLVTKTLLLSQLRLSTDKGPKRSDGTVSKQTRNTDNDAPRGPTQSITSITSWWALLIILLGWNFIGIFENQNTPTVAKLPYSTFITQIIDGNLERVGIQGGEIIGKLKTPREWNRHTGQLTLIKPDKASPTIKSKSGGNSPNADKIAWR